MGVWKSIFFHQFPDFDLDNFQAVEGQLARSNPPPAIGSNSSGVLMRGNEWLSFELANRVNGVIGFDIELSIDVRYRISESPVSIFLMSNQPQVASIVSVGDQFRALVQISAQDLIDSNREAADTVDAKLVVQFGNSTLTYDHLKLSHRKTERLRLNWHTNGQLRVWRKQALIAYANDFAPGSKVVVNHIAPGRSPNSTSDNLQKRIDFFYFKLLREDDAVKEVAREFPTIVSTLPPGIADDPLLERCKSIMLKNTLKTLDQYRSFMSKFIQSATANWQSGDAGASPFSQASIDAHKLSNEAFLHIISFLREADPIQAQNAVEKMTRFFKILHNQLPNDFSALVTILNNRHKEFPYKCRQLMNKIYSLTDPQLPILVLLEKIQQAAAEVAKGGSNG